MVLIFDYDGTLHKSDATYVPAFRKVLAFLDEQGHPLGREVSDAEIGYWLGFSAKEMWEKFAPELPEDLKRTCSEMVGSEMRRLTEAGQAELYPGVTDALLHLRAEGNKTLFLSNCHHSYLEMHRAAFHLERYFDGFYCCEDFDWIPKAEVFPTIRDEWGSGRPVRDVFLMVGDRFHDMEVARRWGLKSVGCAYGFGDPAEIADATSIAKRPEDLLACVHAAMRA